MPIPTAATARRLRVPGDKSISHRALILAALADGPADAFGVLDSADVRATAGALRAMGIALQWDAGIGVVRVEGRGFRGLHAPSDDLQCENSGTTTRLLAGVVAGAGFTARFVGDSSLSRRPMRRIARPLSMMGADLTLSPDDTLPMIVRGGPLTAIDYASPASSAQVKSAVLLAGLLGGVPVSVREPHPSRDHTERMLAARGVPITVDGDRIALEPVDRLPALDAHVPGDPSSAAFPLAFAAAGGAGPDGLIVEAICISPARAGFLDALRRMGAEVVVERLPGWDEPVADVHVRPAPLRGIVVTAEAVPSMIDELPMLAVLASQAEGETVIGGAGELRVKESDRIAAVVANLRAVGVDAEERSDGLVVRGARRPLAGLARTHGDHRLAMAFGVLGALHGGAVTVDDPRCVDVSYPAFWADLAAASAR